MPHSFRTVHVPVGDTPDIFDRLREPLVQAVVLRRAWSAPSLRYLDRAMRNPLYNQPGAEQIWLDELSGDLDLHRNSAFARDYRALRKAFGRIVAQHAGRAAIKDYSRTEATKCPDDASNAGGHWHADDVRLFMLGVPAGLGTQYFDRRPAGRLLDERHYFKPFSPDAAQRLAVRLPADAVIVAKGTEHSHQQKTIANSLIHRKDVEGIAHRPGMARCVVQFAVGGS